MSKGGSNLVKAVKRNSRDLVRADLLKVNRVGSLFFRTQSGTTPGLFWEQRIRLIELRPDSGIGLLTKVQKEDLDLKEAIKKALKGEVRLTCDCPSFLYHGFEYIMGTNKAALRPFTTRQPKITNPSKEGSTCKHILFLIDRLKSFEGDIVAAYSKIL